MISAFVDTTAPLPGWVKDGPATGDDIVFTSDKATVAAHWGGFEDPESGHKSTHWKIFRTSPGNFVSHMILRHCLLNTAQ